MYFVAIAINRFSNNAIHNATNQEHQGRERASEGADSEG